jgi:hypothetical protein
VKAKDLQLKDAAVLMRLSYRQGKRLWRGYQAGGAASLKHGNAGWASNRAFAPKQRQKILRKVQEKYAQRKLSAQSGFAFFAQGQGENLAGVGGRVNAADRQPLPIWG